MTQVNTEFSQTSAISASRTRCQQVHNLERGASRPILRLQSSEIAPRLDSLCERTNGSHGIFQELADAVTGAGHCLAVSDENGILVRLDSQGSTNGNGDWNGIALGSC